MIGTLLVVLVALLCVVLYRRRGGNKKLWQEQGVPYDKPLPLFGNFLKVATCQESLSTFYTDRYNKFRRYKYAGLYEMTSPVLLLIDPDLISKVLVKDFGNFVNRNVGTGTKKSEVGMMLPVLKDGEWRGVRYKLTPAFSSGKLKNMFPYMLASSRTLEEYLDSVSRSDVDIKEATTRFSLDLIASCAFGIDISKDKDSGSEFRLMGRKIFDMDSVGYLCYLLVLSTPSWASKLNLSLIPGKVGSYFAKVIRDAFAMRKKVGLVRKDFVDLLLQLKDKGSIDVQVKDSEDSYLDMDHKPIFESFEITDQILVSQAFAFLTGGFDGLSAPMVFMAYELSKNPEVQDKVRDEIRRKTAEHGSLTYEALKEMTYLEGCVLEGLRLYPLNPFLLRTCGRDYKMEDGVVIPAGTKAVIPVDGLHHDPTYYPDPEKYNPDRFSGGHVHHTTNFTYIPFGAGPRMCIAMRLSLVALKLGLATIVKDHEISLSPRSQAPLRFKIKTFFVKSTENTIYLNLKKIS